MSNICKSGNSMTVSSENMEATVRRCSDGPRVAASAERDPRVAASAERDKGCGGVEQRTAAFQYRRLGTTISHTHF